jgi:hypothetical protein
MALAEPITTRSPVFTDLERLCLPRQCGFASTEKGNIVAEDEQ